MRDLREDLEPVWRATARISPAEPGGRVLMFTSARVGEGVTSMAASFACMAARRAEKPVWLVDLDLDDLFCSVAAGNENLSAIPPLGESGFIKLEGEGRFIVQRSAGAQKTQARHLCRGCPVNRGLACIEQGNLSAIRMDRVHQGQAEGCVTADGRRLVAGNR